MTNLKDIANQMTGQGKGILAADESTPTCTKRFESIGIESTFENRNEYRDLLITANGMEEYIGGVIMFDETLRQSTTCQDKIPFPDHLISKGVVPGIKVDKGAKELAGFNGEKVTEGLDGLRERLQELREGYGLAADGSQDATTTNKGFINSLEALRKKMGMDELKTGHKTWDAYTAALEGTREQFVKIGKEEHSLETCNDEDINFIKPLIKFFD